MTSSLWTQFLTVIKKMVTTAMKLKSLTPWKKSYDQPRQLIKKQRLDFANRGPSRQGCFANSHVWM